MHPVATSALVARLTLVEVRRSRVAVAVAGVAVALLALLGIAADLALDAAAQPNAGTAAPAVVGATLLGTAAFVELLLGAIVAATLAGGTLRGEDGTVGALLARPVSRTAVMAGRLGAAAGVAAAYTLALWLASVLVVRGAGGYTPPAVLGPGLLLAAAVALVALTAVAASSLLPAAVAGIAALTLVGLGFTAGLLAQLGGVYGITELLRIADWLSVLLPYEALYRAVLDGVGAEAGIGGAGLAVGPFGGARPLTAAIGLGVVVWAALVAAFCAWRAESWDA